MNEKYPISFSEEKEKISEFYETYFNYNPNWKVFEPFKSKYNLNHHLLIHSGIKFEGVVNAFASFLTEQGKEIWTPWDNKIIDVVDRKSLQPRPKGDYLILHKGTEKPDLLGLNYQDGIRENISFANPIEGALIAFFHYFVTGRMLDRESTTFFSALSKDGKNLGMCVGSSGKFHIVNYDCGSMSKDPKRGLRRIEYFN